MSGGGGLGYHVRAVLAIVGIFGSFYGAVFFLTHPRKDVRKYAYPMALLAIGAAMGLTGDSLVYYQSSWPYSNALLWAGLSVMAGALLLYISWNPHRRRSVDKRDRSRGQRF